MAQLSSKFVMGQNWVWELQFDNKVSSNLTIKS